MRAIRTRHEGAGSRVRPDHREDPVELCGVDRREDGRPWHPLGHRVPSTGYGASRKIAGQPLCAYTMTAKTIASNSRCTTST